MTSESMLPGRRNAVLATVIGAVLASYAGSAAALDWETDGGTRINWNTTLSVGTSWRLQNPDRLLYTLADGAVIGKYTGVYVPGTYVGRGNGLAGNDAGGDSNLNYERGDRFSTPFKLLSDIEVKKGNFGGLVRFKAWYDDSLENGNVLFGNQANQFNGTSTKQTQFGPTPLNPNCFLGLGNPALCMPLSPPGFSIWPQKPLSDNGFEDEQKFSNIYLLDAYLYGTFELGDTDLQVRLGNQVINWGESIFIQGVNQINPIDVPAARRAGAELKEILLPVWAAYINWGLPFGSLEAFYQFKWNNTSIDSCGTYWGQTNGIISASPGGCRSATPITAVTGASVPGIAQSGSNPFSQYVGLYVPLGKGQEPSDSGQFGLAFRFPVEKIDTEIGLYGMNIHSRLPIASGYSGTSFNSLTAQQQAILTGQVPGVPAIAGVDAIGPYWTVGTTRLRGPAPIHAAVAALAGIDITPGSSFWEYPEDIQIFGLSTASNLGGWSVSSELSYQTDVPIQINGNDLLGSLLLLVGPNRANGLDVYNANNDPANPKGGKGTVIRGYDRFDKTQFQVNALKTFSNILGADNLLVIGEVGAQWNDVPDYTKGTIRYGRGFMHGYGSSPAWNNSPATAVLAGTTCSPVAAGLPPNATAPSPLYNPSPIGCKNDGYVTDFAWGYRLRLSADYNNLLGSGITMTPSIFWSQDVEGVSMDPAFIEDRSVLGLGVKFIYQKKYTFDVNYVQYGDSGYDPLFDRDYLSASVAVTF